MLPEGLRDRGRDEGVLGLEVLVEAAARQADLAHDVGHADRAEVALPEEASRGLDELAVVLFGDRAGRSAHLDAPGLGWRAESENSSYVTSNTGTPARNALI
ncbi:hypothetical protein GCM10009547_49280 [Sporichthya brevicatena]|uniref:Uncharacterized protein n=1 Tax=Sporichthya brevicatena TaxID=171442 RepID=A0ABN1HDE0_9ACTN